MHEQPAEFDVVVVGGGTAGLTAALTARHEGASVALVEKEGRIGGDCSFYGCVPSKALIEVAQTVYEAGLLAAEGILDAGPRPSFQRVAAHRDRVVEELARDERDERFSDAGIELVYGEAAFSGPHELRVGARILRSKRFVVATGSEPAVPALAGLDRVPYLTNRTIFGLTELPRRLIVLGGGAVGLELAQAFHRFGSTVTIVEMADRLLPHNEPEAGELISRVLMGEGIELRLSSRARSVVESGSEIVLALENSEVRGDTLLVAAGRRAAREGLALEQAGVTVENGYVRIDERCRTSARHVFAAGDVTGGLQLTHVAAHEGLVAGRNAAGKRARREQRVVPWVTFVDPEVAHVGLSEAEARARYGDLRVAFVPMSAVDRARIAGRPLGFVKLLAAPRRPFGWVGGGELVGAEVVGPRAGELIQECALAMQTRAFAGRLAQTIHSYPSMSLALQQAAAQLFPIGQALARGRESTRS